MLRKKYYCLKFYKFFFQLRENHKNNKEKVNKNKILV